MKRTVIAVLTVFMLLTSGALVFVSTDMSDSPTILSAERIQTDTVPAGFTGIYSEADLKNIGSGGTGWGLGDKYILMADLTLASSVSEIKLTASYDGAKLTIELEGISSMDVITGDIWIENTFKTLSSGAVEFNTYDGNDHRVTIKGMFGSTAFAYTFMLIGITSGSPVTENFAIKGNFDPIGTKSQPFTGEFNGNGHTITGMDIRQYSDMVITAGMFAVVSEDGTDPGKSGNIYHLNLVDSDLTAIMWMPANISYCAGSTVGLLAGLIDGSENVSIDTVSINGNITAISLSQTSANAHSELDIKSGGIIGESQSPMSMRDCEYEGNVISEIYSLCVFKHYIFAGGIIGYVSSVLSVSTVAGCNSVGEMASFMYLTTTASSGFNRMFTGGIVGYSEVKGTALVKIDDCINDMDVTSSMYVNKISSDIYSVAGGIIGHLNGTVVSNSVNNGTISSFVSVYSSFSYSGYACSYAGGIVGWMYGSDIYTYASLVSCENNATVQMNADLKQTDSHYGYTNFYTGGIAGYIQTGISEMILEDCVNSGTVISGSYVELFSNSFVTNLQNYSGGIVGRFSSTSGILTIEGCTNNADVSVRTVGTESYDVPRASAGGISGYGYGKIETSNIIGCKNTGNITSEIETNNISKSSNTAFLYIYCGGVVGYGIGLSISDCVNSGELKANGNASYDDTIMTVYMGGAVGYADTVSVTATFNNADIVLGISLDDPIGMDPKHNNVPVLIGHLGGIVGYATTVTIISCSNHGNIDAVAESTGDRTDILRLCIGGIMGSAEFTFDSYVSHSSISKSYNSGDLTGTTISNHDSSVSIGGIAGYTRSSFMMTSCYNVGDINAAPDDDGGYAMVGGLVGSVNSSETHLEYSYNAGSVASSGEYSTGALVGDSVAGFRSKGLISLNGVSNELFSGNGINDTGSFFASMAEMRSKRTYEWPGFNSIWGMDPEKNSGLPYLLMVGSDCKISFDSCGGASIDDLQSQSGQFISLPTPVKEGATFHGWFTEPNGQGEKVADSYYVQGDTMLYAYWSQPGAGNPDSALSLLLFIVLLIILSFTIIGWHAYSRYR